MWSGRILRWPVATYFENGAKSAHAKRGPCYKGVHARDFCTPYILALELAMVPSACGRIGRGELRLQQTC
ncbi:MAG: hypothetical protein ACI8QC_000436 [Planctomycetota bacterium]|jgi:hypothetical protein